MGNAQQQILISEVGFNYLQPDIAVTSDGRAFIVFLKASTTANSTYSPQYIIIPAVDPGTPAVQALNPYGGMSDVWNPPQVKSNANNVYTIFSECSNCATKQSLRYRRLSPTIGSAAPFVYQTQTVGRDYDLVYADSIVDSIGRLHVSLRAERAATINPSVTEKLVLYGNTLSSTTPISLVTIAVPTLRIWNTHLAVNHINVAYVTYSLRRNSPDSDELWISERDATPQTIQVPLTLAGITSWNYVFPEISMNGTAASNQPVVAFSSEVQVSPSVFQRDIFVYLWGESSIDRVTNDGLADSSPKIVRFADLFLVAWRKNSYPVCANEVFFSWALDSPVQIFHADIPLCSSYGLTQMTDLSVNEKWLGGVWIDRLSSTNSRAIPWIGFNYQSDVYLPLLKK